MRLLRLALLQGSMLDGLEDLAAAQIRLDSPSARPVPACAEADDPPPADQAQEGPAQEKTAGEGREAGMRTEKQQRTFLWKPFEVVESTIRDGRATTVLQSVAFLCWLLDAFVSALKERQAGKGEAGGQRERDPSLLPGPRSSSDFAMLALLLRLLMRRMEDTRSTMLDSKGPDGRPKCKRKRQTPQMVEKQDSWVILAKGMAALLQIAKARGIYRPTEDKGGRQRQLLTAATQLLLSGCSSASETVREERARAAGTMVAAMLALEHRAVPLQLSSLWSLVWSAASTSGEEGVESARLVGCRLLETYQELRQLDRLLEWLMEAVRWAPPSAALVICSPPFQTSLQKAVERLPGGQLVPVLDKLGAGLRGSFEGGLAGERAAMCALLVGTCLRALPLSSSTAVPAASALRALLTDALAAPLASTLHSGLRESSARAGAGKALLDMYTAALAAHAQCVGLNPSVPPLHSFQLEGREPLTGGVPRRPTFFGPLETEAQSLPSLLEIGLAIRQWDEAAQQTHGLAWCAASLTWLDVLRDRFLQDLHSRASSPSSPQGEQDREAGDLGDLLASHIHEQVSEGLSGGAPMGELAWQHLPSLAAFCSHGTLVGLLGTLLEAHARSSVTLPPTEEPVTDLHDRPRKRSRPQFSQRDTSDSSSYLSQGESLSAGGADALLDGDTEGSAAILASLVEGVRVGKPADVLGEALGAAMWGLLRGLRPSCQEEREETPLTASKRKEKGPRRFLSGMASAEKLGGVDALTQGLRLCMRVSAPCIPSSPTSQPRGEREAPSTPQTLPGKSSLPSWTSDADLRCFAVLGSLGAAVFDKGSAPAAPALLIPLLAGQAALLGVLQSQGGSAAEPPGTLLRPACSCLSATLHLLAALLQGDSQSASAAQLGRSDWVAVVSWGARLCQEALGACKGAGGLESCADCLLDAFEQLLYSVSCAQLLSQSCSKAPEEQGEGRPWNFAWEAALGPAGLPSQRDSDLRGLLRTVAMEAGARALYDLARCCWAMPDAQAAILAEPEGCFWRKRVLSPGDLCWFQQAAILSPPANLLSDEADGQEDWAGWVSCRRFAADAAAAGHALKALLCAPEAPTAHLGLAVQAALPTLRRVSQCLFTGVGVRRCTRLQLISFIHACSMLLPQLEEVGDPCGEALLALHFSLLRDAAAYPQACSPLHHKVSFRDAFPSLSGCEEGKEGVRSSLLASLRSLLLAFNDRQREALWAGLLHRLSSAKAGPALLAALEVTLLAMEEGPAVSQGSSGQVNQAVEACLLIREGLGPWCQGGATVPLLCTALRCIESLLGQKAKFRLGATTALLLFGSPAVVLDRDGLVRRELAAYSAVCQVCVAALRQRAPLLLRGMASFLHCVRRLLAACLDMDLGRGQAAATHLSRVYYALHDGKEHFRPYCYLFISDYLHEVEARELVDKPHALDPQQQQQQQQLGEPLRSSVYAILDCCTSRELQHLHATFEHGKAETLRSLLAALQRDYQEQYRYRGKV
eukprot:jgi/Botrbrau1/10817/Bobra.0064s0021.1